MCLVAGLFSETVEMNKVWSILFGNLQLIELGILTSEWLQYGVAMLKYTYVAAIIGIDQ